MWHGPYPEIEPRTPSGICVECRKPFGHGDRRVPVYIVTALANHPSGSGRAVFAARKTEFRHAMCDNPTSKRSIVVKKPKGYSDLAKVPASAYPDIEPRGPSTICHKCHKGFQRGDRVEIAYIILGSGQDPDTGAVEAVASPNFEIGHSLCEDPQRSGIDKPLVIG